MRKKSKVFLFRRGYWYALGCSLLISFLYGFKYTVVLKDNPGALEVKKGLLNMGFLFIIFATASLLVCRWYYKMKDTPSRS